MFKLNKLLKSKNLEKKWLMQNLRIILFRRNEKTKKIIKELIK